MKGATRWLVHLANGAVAATGVVWFVMKFLMEPVDEWAVVNHPWQPVMQHLHVLTAPLLVFLVGYIWRDHVVRALASSRTSRRSGIGLIASFAPLAASGYLLQVSVDEGWRAIWSYLHLGTGGVWLLAFGGHLAASLAAWARRAQGVRTDPSASSTSSRDRPPSAA